MKQLVYFQILLLKMKVFIQCSSFHRSVSLTASIDSCNLKCINTESHFDSGGGGGRGAFPNFKVMVYTVSRNHTHNVC